MDSPFQEHRSWPDGEYQVRSQLENWHNLRDMANALRYGFSQYRLATPGRVIAVDQARLRVEGIQHEWEREARGRKRDDQSNSPPFNSLSDDGKCYLHDMISRGNSD